MQILSLFAPEKKEVKTITEIFLSSSFLLLRKKVEGGISHPTHSRGEGGGGGGGGKKV